MQQVLYHNVQGWILLIKSITA